MITSQQFNRIEGRSSSELQSDLKMETRTRNSTFEQQNCRSPPLEPSSQIHEAFKEEDNQSLSERLQKIKQLYSEEKKKLELCPTLLVQAALQQKAKQKQALTEIRQSILKQQKSNQHVKLSPQQTSLKSLHKEEKSAFLEKLNNLQMQNCKQKMSEIAQIQSLKAALLEINKKIQGQNSGETLKLQDNESETISNAKKLSEEMNNLQLKCATKAKQMQEIEDSIWYQSQRANQLNSQHIDQEKSQISHRLQAISFTLQGKKKYLERVMRNRKNSDEVRLCFTEQRKEIEALQIVCKELSDKKRFLIPAQIKKFREKKAMIVDKVIQVQSKKVQSVRAHIQTITHVISGQKDQLETLQQKYFELSQLPNNSEEKKITMKKCSQLREKNGVLREEIKNFSKQFRNQKKQIDQGKRLIPVSMMKDLKNKIEIKKDSLEKLSSVRQRNSDLQSENSKFCQERDQKQWKRPKILDDLQRQRLEAQKLGQRISEDLSILKSQSLKVQARLSEQLVSFRKREEEFKKIKADQQSEQIDGKDGINLEQRQKLVNKFRECSALDDDQASVNGNQTTTSETSQTEKKQFRRRKSPTFKKNMGQDSSLKELRSHCKVKEGTAFLVEQFPCNLDQSDYQERRKSMKPIFGMNLESHLTALVFGFILPTIFLGFKLNN